MKKKNLFELWVLLSSLLSIQQMQCGFIVLQFRDYVQNNV